MRIYTQNIPVNGIKNKTPEELGKKTKYKTLGKIEIGMENTTTTGPDGKTEKRTIKKMKIELGKEDYGAFLILILLLIGLYSKAITVEWAIYMIGAIFLGWGGITSIKSKDIGKPTS